MATIKKSSNPTTAETNKPADQRITSYWERASWPLHGLYFLLIPLLAYELGVFFFSDSIPRILTDSTIRKCFETLEVPVGIAYFFPALLVAAVLLGWHISGAGKNGWPWQAELKLYPVMLCECILLAVPLYIASHILTRDATVPAIALQQIEHVTTVVQPASPLMQLRDGILLSMGAGIFEELVFRLIGMSLIHFVLADLFGMRKSVAAAFAVIGSALAFALHHYTSGGMTAFIFSRRFLFYMVAGAYLALVYGVRGFGIAAGTHAAYDVMFYIAQYKDA